MKYFTRTVFLCLAKNAAIVLGQGFRLCLISSQRNSAHCFTIDEIEKKKLKCVFWETMTPYIRFFVIVQNDWFWGQNSQNLNEPNYVMGGGYYPPNRIFRKLKKTFGYKVKLGPKNDTGNHKIQQLIFHRYLATRVLMDSQKWQIS